MKRAAKGFSTRGMWCRWAPADSGSSDYAVAKINQCTGLQQYTVFPRSFLQHIWRVSVSKSKACFLDVGKIEPTASKAGQSVDCYCQ